MPQTARGWILALTSLLLSIPATAAGGQNICAEPPGDASPAVETATFRAAVLAVEMDDAQVGRMRLRLTNPTRQAVLAGVGYQVHVGGWFRNRDLRTGDVFVYELAPESTEEVSADFYVAGYSHDTSLRLEFGSAQAAAERPGHGRLLGVDARLECDLGRSPWVRREMERFAVEASGRLQAFGRKGFGLGDQLLHLAEERDRALTEVANLLGTEPPARVRVVIYPDPFLKWIDTGHWGSGWAFDSTVVEVHGGGREMDPFHELTHVLADRIGSPPPLFSEGLATYVGERLGGGALAFLGRQRRVHEAVCDDLGAGRSVPIHGAMELSSLSAGDADAGVLYPQGASFVGFLVRHHGMDTLLAAYGRLTAPNGPDEVEHNTAVFRDVFGISLREAGVAWLEEVSRSCRTAAPGSKAEAPGASPALDSVDRALLSVLDASLRASAAGPPAWRNYRLADEPLLAYRPEGWAVLINPPEPNPEGWTPYPEDWPALPVPALVRPGGIEGLIGQLAFNHEVPGGRAVAVPLFPEIPPELGPRDRYLFAFLNHESFHQHQRSAFADVDTPSEEAYPILNAENNARAALEMQVLEEALAALEGGDTAAVRIRTQEALAIHGTRREALDPTARAIERAKEIVEGTAKYVETKAVAALARRCRTERAGGAERGLCGEVRTLTPSAWISLAIDQRLADGALSPRDVPRNRIYPVGAALAFLLDLYAPGWQTRVERAGTRRSLHDRLSAAVGPWAGDRSRLARQAMERHGWDGILERSREAVRAYVDDFERALTEFREQAGTRVVVELSGEGLERSRSSREPRWTMDRGRRVLGTFVAYTLRRRQEPALSIRIRGRTVLDESPGAARKRITFHVDAPPLLHLDGDPVPLRSESTKTFRRLRLMAEGVELQSDMGGVAVWRGGTLRIELREP